MTFDVWSIMVLAVILAGMVLGWMASLYIGRVLLVVWRLAVAVGFGVLAVYLFYAAWPYLVEMQHAGWVYFPEGLYGWEVVVR